jgi:hypothetical protein
VVGAVVLARRPPEVPSGQTPEGPSTP